MTKPWKNFWKGLFLLLCLPSNLWAGWVPAIVNKHAAFIYRTPSSEGELLGDYPIGTLMRVYFPPENGFCAVYFSTPWKGAQYGWVSEKAIEIGSEVVERKPGSIFMEADSNSLGPYSINDFSSLHFYTPGNKFFVKLSPSLFSNSSTATPNGTTNVTSTTETRTQYSLLAEYGLFDRFRISTTWSFSSSSAQQTTTGASPTTLKSTGISDPLFKMSYRLLENPRLSTFLDLSLLASPSLGKETPASATVVGNTLRGSSWYALGLTGYMTTAIHEFSLGASLSYYQDKVSTVGTTTNAFFKGSVDASYRIHIGSKFWLQGALQVGSPTVTKTIFTFLPQITDNEFAFSLNPEFQAGYTFSNRIQVNLLLNYSTSNATQAFYSYSATAILSSFSSKNLSASVSFLFLLL